MCSSDLEKTTELGLKNSIQMLDLLLFPQLHCIIGRLAKTILPVLPRRKGPSFKGAFVGIAMVSFQEQLEIFSSANPAGCPTVSSQILPPAISLHFIRRHKKTCYLLSNTTPFRRFAPIMRQERDIQYYSDRKSVV